MTWTYGVLNLDVLPRIVLELLDAKRHLAFLTVEGEDYGFYFVAYLEEVLSWTQVLAPAHFAYVDKTFYTRSDFNECTVVSHNNYFTLNLVTYLEVFVKSIPRMGSELLQTKSDTLLFFIEVEDYYVELLIELYDFVGIVYAAPRKVGNVDQTVYATEVDEHTVRSDILNSTFEYLTLLKLRDDFLLLSFEFSLDECLVWYNNILVFLVDLNNLEFHCLTNEYVVVADGLNVDLWTGQEGLDTEDVNNHTTLSAALDVTLDNFLVLESGINAFPRLACTSLLVWEHELATLVFLIFNVYLYSIAYLQVRIVTEFVYGDDTVALVADVYNYFALTNWDYCTFYNFVFVYTTEGCVVSFLSFFVALSRFYSTVLECVPVKVRKRCNVF